MESAKRLSIYAKYPFLPEAKEHLSSYGLTIESFRDQAYSKIVERARLRIIDAIKLGERIGLESLGDDELVELASYPLAIILVASIGDSYLARRYALAESSIAIKLLELEDKELITKIAREVFKMDVRVEETEIGGVRYDYSIALKDYLDGALAFNRPEWKLVNRILIRGRVLITSKELVRLMKDKIMDHILESIEKISRRPPKLPENLEKVVQEIRSMIPSKRFYEELEGEISPEAWPPCIKLIHQRLLKGENVSHFANFTLASFLVNIGMELEKILSIYSRRPDFDQRIARYQIEHIAGLRGSRTKYTTPSCETLKTNGLCVEGGRLCGGVKNPLTYYRRRLRRREIDKGEAEPGGERG